LTLASTLSGVNKAETAKPTRPLLLDDDARGDEFGEAATDASYAELAHVG
jgi:hypothetical protein